MIIDVIDTGPGMTSDELQKLFKPFSQANETIKSKYGGTGLGLWITKQLVHLIGGLIEVRSVLNKGTRFRITLPAKVAQNEIPFSPPLLMTSKWEESGVATKSTLPHTGHGAFSFFRQSGRMKLYGRKDTLSGMKILLVEDENLHEDTKIEQILLQLKYSDCEIIYASYSTCLNTIFIYEFKFSSIILISSSPSSRTKFVLQEMNRILPEKGIDKTQIILATSKFIC